MTQQFAVDIGPFTGRIHAGLVDKAGTAFTSKQDCTDQAVRAVAVYVLRQDGELTVTDHRGNQIRIRAELLVAEPADDGQLPMNTTDEEPQP